MAATAIPVYPAKYQRSTDLATLAIEIDNVNGMTLSNPKNQTIVFYILNGSVMTSTNVTVTSVVDQAGRGNSSCDNINAQTVAAGETRMFGPFNAVWWNQPNGLVNVAFSAGSASIKIVGIQIA